jgi:tetratricopeptide (TPR) repeat protein
MSQPPLNVDNPSPSFSRGVRLLCFLILFPLVSGAAYSAGPQNEATPEDTFKAGAAAFQSGNYEEAAKNFETVLVAGPTGEALDTILFTLASTYFNQKNLPKAESYYTRCIKEFPDGKNKTKALIAISQIQNQTGRKAEAEQTLKKASEGTGDLAARARLAQASMLAESGKPDEAVAAIRPMIAGGIKDDLSAQAGMAIVEIESKQGHLDDALKLLDQLQAASDLIDNPLQLDILAVRIGDALLAKGEREKALRMYAIVRPKQVVSDLQKKRIEAIDKTIADNTAGLQKNPKAFMEVNATNARLKEDQKQLQTVLEQFEKLPDTELPVRLRQAKAYDELDQKWETILIWESILESSKDPKVRDDALFSIAAAYCSLGRVDDGVSALDRYLVEYPAGKYASQVGYLKGAVALEAGDYPKAETVFGTLMAKGDSSALAADIQFLLANSEFAQASDSQHPQPSKYKEAIEDYQKYLSKYPTGKFAEESAYRIPLCSFQLGDYAKALEGFQNYAKKFPKGTFAGDAGYRIALCYQAANKYDDVIRLCQEWVKQHDGEVMQAEILSLKGDAFAAKEMPAESAAAYRESVNFSDSDELLKYSLFQANTQYQKLNRWDDIAEMFNRFIEHHPKHPAVVAAVFWVSKAKIKQGKPEEAKKYLAENILKNINDRRQDAVEQLLTQLAQTCAKRPRPSLIASQNAAPQEGSASKAPADAQASPTPRPSPTPLPPYDADADFAKYLNESSAGNTPLAKARLRFTLAQLAGFTKRQDRQKELMASIYKDFTADQLSAMLLSECGQIALEQGQIDKAELFFKELMTSFPKSDLLEYAYCGMGQVSLARNQPENAIKWFDDAVNKASADATLAQVTYGKGIALLAQAKFDEAKKIFEQVASTKDWRGEITAKALMSLGELEEKRGNPSAAIQYYQRVFVAYQRYPAVVIPAYLKAADAFVKLGKPEDAAKDLRDLLSKPRLAASPLAEEARKKLESLPPEPTPAVPAVSGSSPVIPAANTTSSPADPAKP